MQDNQSPIVPVCRQDGGVVCGLPGAQSDDALVVLKRSRQIADLQMYWTQRGGVGQYKGGPSHTVRPRIDFCVHDTSPCLRWS